MHRSESHASRSIGTSIRGARHRRTAVDGTPFPRPTGPATRWRDLRGYDLEGKTWAVALLAGLALSETIHDIDGHAFAFAPVAVALGAACGWPRRPSRLAALGPGLVGALASVIGSVSFVSGAPSAADWAVRFGLVLAIALMSVLGILVRAQPLGALTWFATLDIAVFLSGPAGLSWAQIGDLTSLIPVTISIGVAIFLALVPEFTVTLAALGVVLTNLIGIGTGLFPGDFGWDITPLVLTMIVFFITRAIRRRLG